jgi:hypothetical protein
VQSLRCGPRSCKAPAGRVSLRYNDRLAGRCRVCLGGIALLAAKPGKNVIGFKKEQIAILDFPSAGAFQRFQDACFQARLQIRARHAGGTHWAECERRPVKFVAAEEIVAPRKTCRLLLCRVQQNMRLLVICHQRYRQTAHLRQIPLDAFNASGFRTGRRGCLLHAGHQQHGDA